MTQGLEQRLAVPLTKAVAAPFSQAVEGAARRITGDLHNVRDQANQAVEMLKQSSGQAVESIQGQAKLVESRMLWYIALGGVYGVPLGFLFAWLLMHMGVISA